MQGSRGRDARSHVVMLAPESCDPISARLVTALPDPPGSPTTLVLDAGCERADVSGAARLLLIGALGTHPDARAARLRCLWRVEESARASSRPLLVLRVGPLLGPSSPLWRRLRSRPRLPGRGRALLCPVDESDVKDAVSRALAGSVAWEGWFEIGGPEPLTLQEMSELAMDAGPPLPAPAGAWEPPVEEMEEHRLVDIRPWIAHFGVVPGRIRDRARHWA